MINFLVSIFATIFSFNTSKPITNNQSALYIPSEIFLNVYPTPKDFMILDEFIILEEKEHPYTNKIQAYNTKSEKVIREVAKVAVENSPVLVPLTPTPTPSPTRTQEPPKEMPTPTVMPTPIPIKPPIPIDPPKPTIIPIPEPTKVSPIPTITITPIPIKPPIPLPDPCYCPPNQNCLMIACPETK